MYNVQGHGSRVAAAQRVGHRRRDGASLSAALGELSITLTPALTRRPESRVIESESKSYTKSGTRLYNLIQLESDMHRLANPTQVTVTVTARRRQTPLEALHRRMILVQVVSFKSEPTQESESESQPRPAPVPAGASRRSGPGMSPY